MTPNSTIAHYRIVSKIGEGGMGAVYRATDLKLGRDVAIKVLPEAFANDPDRLARFTREAQLLAALNHPNIATIHGIEESAIVMELIEGPTLADRLAQTALPLDEAVSIARQIAEALDAAHEKGIVHRDLKPANVKVTAAGQVKILDFGLAKLADPRDPADDPATAATVVRGNSPTMAGMIMGTAGYMSPEQARGLRVDKRADVWAFGVVLFEMLSGRPLFGGGETVTDEIAAVVTRQPEWSLLPAGTPVNIRRLLDRCLRKDLKTRLRDIGEARIVLEEGPIEPVAPSLSVSATSRRVWLPYSLLVVSALGGAFGWWLATRPPALRPLVRLHSEIAPDMTISGNARLYGGLMALSPDGSRLAVTLRAPDGKTRIYTRLLHQPQPVPLAGTEDATSPFFSPDGRWIGFESGGKLKKIAVDGGAAVTLCDVHELRGASWGADGNIVYGVRASGLWKVSSAGGAPQPLTKVSPVERNHRWPQALQNGQTILFTASESNEYDSANVEVFFVKTGQRKILQRGAHSGRYLTTPNGSGRLIYVHQGTLFGAPFDLDRMEMRGAPVPVLEGISTGPSVGADLTLSHTGTLAYLPGKRADDVWAIYWVDSSGKVQTLEGKRGRYFSPRFSPDGKRLAFSVAHAAGADIWVKDLDRETSSRLTFLKGVNNFPTWTPDGKGIIFSSRDPGSPGLYWIRSDGAGEPIRLTEARGDEVPGSISPDGKSLAFIATGKGSRDLFTAAIEGDTGRPKLGAPKLFLGAPHTEINPRFSPDGRWLAYSSNESGRLEVYVRPFPGPGGRWQISAEGGSVPAWSPNGRELFYRGPEGLMVVSYTGKGESFTPGRPTPWATPRIILDTAGVPTWDLAPDGKRIAAFVRDSDDEKPATHLTFLLNFSDELQRRGNEGGER